MSLRTFHIAFITVSTFFFGGFAAWCLLVTGLPGMFKVMGWGSALCGVAMLVYGIRFLKKTKTLVL
ncbi:MAG: hypothetical protein GXX91_08505 [Verrucomicrobiaceae bacterium]|nr:hypothetical protein [Verrucomicrobiaceae bacterium]